MAAKGIVKFREDRCKGCELCVSVCPMKCLGIRKDIVNKQGYHPAGMKPGEEGKCIGCATCAIMCPDGVINVYQE